MLSHLRTSLKIRPRFHFYPYFQDYENVDDVNRQLEKMGYNIGVRLVEDFLARTGSGKCHDFRDTAEKIQLAFKVPASC
jgi:hypothetical protein